MQRLIEVANFDPDILTDQNIIRLGVSKILGVNPASNKIIKIEMSALILITFLINLQATLISLSACLYLFIKSRMNLDKSAIFLIIIFQAVFTLKLVNVSLFLKRLDPTLTWDSQVSL